MRAPLFVVAVLGGAALSFVACAHGDSIGSAGGAGTEGTAGGGKTTGSTSTATTTTGSTGTGETCGAYVGPDVTACCTACTKAGETCQKNGCYNGYWCKPSTCGCSAKPATCN
jgi:hypothetical protein